MNTEMLLKMSGDLSSAKIIGENDDVIRIMSIHKSKKYFYDTIYETREKLWKKCIICKQE